MPFRVRDFYVCGLVFLRLEVIDCYLRCFVFFLRLEVRDTYVLGLVFLRLRLVVLTFRGSNSYVWGLVTFTFGSCFLTFRGQ